MMTMMTCVRPCRTTYMSTATDADVGTASMVDTHATVIGLEPCPHPADRRSTVTDWDWGRAVFCDDCGDEMHDEYMRQYGNGQLDS